MASEQEISTEIRERVGLCVDCRFLLEQGTKRGAVFFRCARADEDDTFGRYPALPVLHCRGHERRDHDRGDAPGIE